MISVMAGMIVIIHTTVNCHRIVNCRFVIFVTLEKTDDPGFRVHSSNAKTSNMGSRSIRNMTIAVLGTLVVSIGLIQCTKDNVNANLIDRDLVSQPDSSVFASFYDTVLIDKRDATPDVNDVITTTGVQSIVRTYCASPSCHGGNINPKLTN